jgi:hypothetical protein
MISSPWMNRSIVLVILGIRPCPMADAFLVPYGTPVVALGIPASLPCE